jgi:hypothetical protein
MTPTRFFAALLAASLLALPSAGAEIRERPKAVVELFTSQGCSSCPKADALIARLDERKDLIALAFHVDYWDYIGWADTFGSEAHSKRQRGYAQGWGSSRVYTPQMVINGEAGVIGSKEAEVAGAINSATLDVPVDLTLGDDMLEIAIGPNEGIGHAMVWLVRFRGAEMVDIERGENAGKSIEYRQIVTGRQMLGMWDSAGGTRLRLPLSEITAQGSDGAAILVQMDKNGLPGPILGAASIEL